MEDRLRLEIINWEKFNQGSRKDVKRPSWFAVEIGFAMSESLEELSAEEVFAFLNLLALARKKNSGAIDVSISWFLRFCGGKISRDILDSTVCKLAGKCLKLQKTARHVHVTRTSRARADHVTLQDKTRQDRTIQDIPYGEALKPVPAFTPPGGAISVETASGLVPIKNQTGGAIAHWVSEYQKRYGCRPTMGGKDQGIIKTLVRDHGLEYTCQLMSGYLQIRDRRLDAECHPLNLLQLQVTRISTSIQNGVESMQTKRDWEEFNRLCDETERAKK